jgi:hypothetical protein
MAELSLAEYEAALDDITRRGVAAIRHHHDDAQKTVQLPISQRRLRERPLSEGIKASSESVSGAIVQSMQARPYTTLAIAGLIGFACAALRR